MKPKLFLALAVPVLLLAGCNSPGVTDSTDLDGPVRGDAGETRFVAGTDGSAVGLGDLSKVARTIRKYRNLAAGDQEIVRRVAALKLDGLVASQMRILAPQFERKKAVVRQTAKSKVAAVRGKGAAERLPVAVVEKEVAAVQAEEVREIQQIDLDWKSAAHAEVAKNYGTDFAVPVQNADGKAVVAFASLMDTGVSVSAASYELEGTSGQLASAASAGRQISHEGRSYALLDTGVQLQ